MFGSLIDITKNPPEDGRYMVKFRKDHMPEYDCTENAIRDFINGKWVNPWYGHPKDGYKMVGWYSNKIQ